MTTLPPAINWILPALVEDAGRARAETLMIIQGAGPDYVRPHLAGIHTALGEASPGLAALEDLIRQSEEAVSTSQPTVAKQHFISRVVLRRFVEDVPPGGRQLTKVDLGSGNIELISTRGVGFVEHFVPVDSKTTEELWQQVEDRLPTAIDAALAGTALGNSAHLTTLRRAVALHLVRNPETVTVHNKAFYEALEQGVERWAATSFAAESFNRRYGLVAAGPEGLRLGAEAAEGRLIELHRQGGLFRLSVQRLYEKVCDRLASRGVEILTPVNRAKEFLLGDVPAVTCNTTSGDIGFASGVAIDQADEVFMPLAPGLLVVLTAADRARFLSDAEVDAYNQAEVRSAREYVIHRPSANFSAEIASGRR